MHANTFTLTQKIGCVYRRVFAIWYVHVCVKESAKDKHSKKHAQDNAAFQWSHLQWEQYVATATIEEVAMQQGTKILTVDIHGSGRVSKEQVKNLMCRNNSMQITIFFLHNYSTEIFLL